MKPWRYGVEANRAQKIEPARFADHHQRHPIDHERLVNPRDEPIAKPIEIEVAVQVASERDQRSTIVVPITIERPIDRRLHRLFDGPGQQDHDDGGQKGDQPAMLILVLRDRAARAAKDDDVDGGDGRDDGGVDEQTFEDDLHVHQAIPHDRRRKRERDERQRYRGQLHR